MADTVECHSGYTYAEKPTALTWQGRHFTIKEILTQGRTPQLKWFRVMTTDGQVFELSFDETMEDGPSECGWKIHQV